MSILLIHGGAGRSREAGRRVEIAQALCEIADAAWPTLEAAGSRAAVVHAVQLLEDNPLFNAGLGSKVQADGEARLSASLMDGSRERFAGVVNVIGLANPILLCRQLLEDRDRVLCGEGALARARELGLREADVRTEEVLQAWREKKEGETGTVGAIALDSAGHSAAATSTGGRGMERIGRVSDSCTVAGNFANHHAAVTTTGIGEDIVDAALAPRVATEVRVGQSLDLAAESLLADMNHHGWRAGFIALDARGEWVAHHTTEAFYWCARGDSLRNGFWRDDDALEVAW